MHLTKAALVATIKAELLRQHDSASVDVFFHEDAHGVLVEGIYDLEAIAQAIVEAETTEAFFAYDPNISTVCSGSRNAAAIRDLFDLSPEQVEFRCQQRRQHQSDDGAN